MERAADERELATYSRQFALLDADGDGRHSKTEYIDNGKYLSPMARRGIFNAADADRNGFVSEAEYILNRLITDEAKAIVGAMDDDRDGRVKKKEFLRHTELKLEDRQLAAEVFAALDTSGDGVILVPEYLRVWGEWARAGHAPASVRLTELRRATPADGRGTLLFADGFERSESQEITDEISMGWESNSKRRAAGHKQVDLRDGAMYIYRHELADHGVSVTHPAEFRDGAVALRFMLEDKGDSLGLNFADPQCKEVHAGHLFAARLSTTRVLLQDLKTGGMDLEIRELRKAKKLSADQKKLLAAKEKKITHQLETGRWYGLLIEVSGDTLRVAIDGEEIGTFRSEGIAHPTKRMLRLAVPRNAVVDDVKIWKR